MTDATRYAGSELEDACPVHGEETTREYDFGKYADATIYKYGCGCCSVVANTGFDDGGFLFPNYDTAVGNARLIVAKEDAFANKHGF